MASFTNFQEILPDPNNTIGDAGEQQVLAMLRYSFLLKIRQ